MLVSLCLIPERWLDAENSATLHILGGALAEYGKPFIVGGDMNMTPQELRSWHGLNPLQATVVAPGQATCRERVVDFFIMSQVLLPRIVGIDVLEEVETAPHRPVRLTMRDGGNAALERRLVAPLPFADRPPPVRATPRLDWASTMLSCGD